MWKHAMHTLSDCKGKKKKEKKRKEKKQKGKKRSRQTSSFTPQAHFHPKPTLIIHPKGAWPPLMSERQPSIHGFRPPNRYCLHVQTLVNPLHGEELMLALV